MSPTIKNRPMKAIAPTTSRTMRVVREMERLCFDPSWFDGQTKASKAPISNENARVSVP